MQLKTKWEHQTADNLLTHGAAVGIDLFDDVSDDGVPVTAIYVRYSDGTRYPARTVNTSNPEHAKSVLDAWAKKGPVNDYRQKKD